MSHNHSGNAHATLCANRNSRIALIFVALSGMGVALSWRSLHNQDPVKIDMVFLLGHLIAIAVLIQLFVTLKCIRERLALGLATAKLSLGLFSGLVPSVVSPTSRLVKVGSLLLWVLAAILSISMLASSLQRQKSPVS